MNKKTNEQYKSNEKTILDVFTKLLEEKDIQKITIQHKTDKNKILIFLKIIRLKRQAKC